MATFDVVWLTIIDGGLRASVTETIGAAWWLLPLAGKEHPPATTRDVPVAWLGCDLPLAGNDQAPFTDDCDGLEVVDGSSFVFLLGLLRLLSLRASSSPLLSFLGLPSIN